MNLFVEVEGIEDHNRCGDQGNESKQRVHGEHKGDGQRQKQGDAENRRKLLGQKILGGVDVRSAALDDVTGAVFHIPGEGQMLDVGK